MNTKANMAEYFHLGNLRVQESLQQYIKIFKLKKEEKVVTITQSQ